MIPTNKRPPKASLGASSILITLFTFWALAILNYLSSQYPQQLDFTENKIHTFSDQSNKVMKGLKDEVKAEFYGEYASKERFRPIIQNYLNLSTKFKFELVDPNKEPTRAKLAGVNKDDTLVLFYQGRKVKLEEISEEKITNAILSLTKENNKMVCMIIGHGEASISNETEEGILGIKNGFEAQVYDVKEFILAGQPAIPADCSLIAMVGVRQSLFPREIKMISNYLKSGGRAVFAMEGPAILLDQTKEFRAFLTTWGVEVKTGLILDPVSRQLGVDASVPIVARFNSNHAITKNFNSQCYFPFSLPVEPAAHPPSGISIDWLAKTSSNAWDEIDVNSVSKRNASYQEGVDTLGPLTTAVAVSTKDTRIVVFGSSQFVNNKYSRFGGNLDFFLNAVSWALNDENKISIRTKDNGDEKITLTKDDGMIIFWLSVVIIPLIIAILGFWIWIRRKKL